jgi:hypothetical protein
MMHDQPNIKIFFYYVLLIVSYIDKYFRQKLYRISTTHFVFNNFIFFFENLLVYEIIMKNTIQPHRPQMKIRHMRIACWLPKSTKTHLECVKHIALPLLQWLHERASLLRSTYIACHLVLLDEHTVHHQTRVFIFPFIDDCFARIVNTGL